MEYIEFIAIKLIFNKKPMNGGTPAIDSRIINIVYFLTGSYIFLNKERVLPAVVGIVVHKEFMNNMIEIL